MPIPKIRVYLSPTSQQPILGSINAILNGLVGATLGYFPYRHPSDRVDFIDSAVHADREYSPELAARVLTLRNRLQAISSDRIRLDVIDITLWIFAVGVSETQKRVKEGIVATTISEITPVFCLAAVPSNGA